MRVYKLFLCLLILCLLGVSVSAKDYEVRFCRPLRVGDEYSLEGTATEKTAKKISIGGKVVKKLESDSSVTLACDVKVLKVNKNGLPTAVRCVVSKMDLKLDGKVYPTLKKGAVVDIAVEGKKQKCAMDGKPLSEALSKLLNSIVRLARFEFTEDEVFGTTERRSVGESWSLNKERLIANMADEADTQLSPPDIKGSAKILKLLNAEGSECLLVEYAFELSKLKSPKLPGTLKLKSALKRVMSRSTLPVDGKTPKLASDDSISLSLVMEGKMNPKTPDMRMTVTNEKKRNLKYKYNNLER